MIISDGLAYLQVRFSTYEEMESFTKVIINPYGEWKPQDLENNFQQEDYEDNVRFGANFSAINFTQYSDAIESTLPAPQYKDHNFTFVDDMDFTKGTTDDEFFYDIPELDT